jgi:site-specific recombinase XerD
MAQTQKLALTPSPEGLLSRQEFQQLTKAPPAAEWFANINNERTRCAYRGDVQDFMSFVGLGDPREFQIVTRAHVLAWRKSLEQRLVSAGSSETRCLSGASIRRKLSALSSLFEYLCEKNAVTHNPVKGVKVSSPVEESSIIP